MKNDINNYYVGELYFTSSIGNLLLNNRFSEKSMINSQCDLIMGGAISLRDYTNFQNSLNYKGYFTLFYKTSDDEYVCLHNGQKYSRNSTNFCNNLVNLSNFLPGISYTKPDTLSIREAQILFKKLFVKKSNDIHFDYNKEEFPIEDFYLGNLNLYTGFKENNQNGRFIYHNLAEKYILDARGLSQGSGHAIDDKERNKYGKSIGLHWYNGYRSLLLKLDDNSVYNVNNYQVYNCGVLKNENYTIKKVGESYFERCKPIREVLLNNNQKCNEELVSIAHVLKKCNKIR